MSRGRSILTDTDSRFLAVNPSVSPSPACPHRAAATPPPPAPAPRCSGIISVRRSPALGFGRRARRWALPPATAKRPQPPRGAGTAPRSAPSAPSGHRRVPPRPLAAPRGGAPRLWGPPRRLRGAPRALTLRCMPAGRRRALPVPRRAAPAAPPEPSRSPPAPRCSLPALTERRRRGRHEAARP